MPLYEDTRKPLNDFETRFQSTELCLTLSHCTMCADPETGGANFSSSKEGTGSAPSGRGQETGWDGEMAQYPWLAFFLLSREYNSVTSSMGGEVYLNPLNTS